MKESPIIFSTPMVKAILDNRKSMTRRVIKNQDLCGAPRGGFEAYEIENGKFGFENEDDIWVCKQGRPGDLLWVREKFCIGAICEEDTVDGYSTGSYIDQCKGDDSFIPYEYAIRSNVSIEEVKWKPSIFMPKKYCRIWLKIKNIKVERLQDISEKDALAEGIERSSWEYSCEPYRDYRYPKMAPGRNCSTAIYSFCTLWDSINGKPRKNGTDISWAANPWVWVIEFERTDKPRNTEGKIL